jgi:hypothetical protein
MRKKRSDRNHLIYMLTCEPTDERYIGVTVMSSQSKTKALKQRWQGHLYKALKLNEEWELPAAIREYGADNFSMSILDIVRGKKAAFAVESALINELGTELNTRRKQ